METHAHHLHKAPGNKFWHYFFEFFMLFLAVFCGFLVENYREHKAEHERSNQYVRSLIDDLKQDTTQMNKVLYVDSVMLKGFDLLLATLAKPGNDSSFIKQCYAYSLLYTYSYQEFSFADATIAQLKNSGGLRMISNLKVAKRIMEYDAHKEICLKMTEELEKYFHIVENTQKEILDYSLVKAQFDSLNYGRLNNYLNRDPLKWLNGTFYLISKDPDLLTRYYNDVLFYQTTVSMQYVDIVQQNQMAVALINLIKKEFDIK